MRFLLIHGSWHGAWCWYKIAPRLRAEGHEAVAVDLPGRGAGWPALIGTRQMLAALQAALPETGKTTIVVHSRYGVLASQLAELEPDRIARTIYLASFMLPNGANVASYFRSDAHAPIKAHVEVNRPGLWDALDPSAYRDILYHDCDDADNELAAQLLCREPLRPAISKLKLTDERYGRVPRAYIRLTEDRAVSIELQDRLLNETSVDQVETIQSGHSAYFSQPDLLTGKILKLASN